MAIEELKKLGVEMKAVSSFYTSEGWGSEELSEFINMAIHVQTTIPPHDLLKNIKQIERSMGRNRVEVQNAEQKYVNRNIDIDILYYDDLMLQTDELQIPHPYIEERMFVLMPLNEIAADFKEPSIGKRVSQMIKDCNDANKVSILS